MTSPPSLIVGLTAVILAITDEQPRVLTVPVPGATRVAGGAGGGGVMEALPSGPLDPSGDRTLELALRRWVRASAGIELGYVEQLYTFADRFRDPRELEGGPRVVSVGYLALVRESPPASGVPARWRSAYRFFPWEDWRGSRPQVIDARITPALDAWVKEAGSHTLEEERRERAAITFGIHGAAWDGERVLERYELLYELRLAAEAIRDGLRLGAATAGAELVGATGVEMAHDHRRILAAALGRMRGKLKYRPVIFELMPPTFTLLQLQRAVEALAGVRLHKQNFRRLVEQGGRVEGTGALEGRTGGRPAELFRFRREVVLERPAPGVGLPGARRQA